jgi:hypothetical protein
MTDSVKQLLNKLDNPYWTPHPTSRYLVNWQGKVSAFNLYWVLQGRPSSQAADALKKNSALWQFAGRTVTRSSPSSLIGDSVVAMTPHEFYRFEVLKHHTFYSTLLSIDQWCSALCDPSLDHAPIDLSSLVKRN